MTSKSSVVLGPVRNYGSMDLNRILGGQARELLNALNNTDSVVRLLKASVNDEGLAAGRLTIGFAQQAGQTIVGMPSQAEPAKMTEEEYTFFSDALTQLQEFLDSVFGEKRGEGAVAMLQVLSRLDQ